MAGENVTAAVAEQATQAVGAATQKAAEWYSGALALLEKYGVPLIGSLLILIIGKWAAKMLSRILERAMQKGKVNQTLISFASNIVYFLLMIFVILAALENIGVRTTPFAAFLGAGALAVGLALQGTLANFAGGVMLILFAPFQVGDSIEAAGAAGTVKEIQIFNTVLMTPDNKKVIIPNAKITGDKITINLAAKK